jgi:hypothetical protein
VVWKLDRLSRSLRGVLTIMERLDEANAGFRSLTRRSTPPQRRTDDGADGGAFAEFKRSMLCLRERLDPPAGTPNSIESTMPNTSESDSPGNTSLDK